MLAEYTIFHVVISLIAIATGFIVLFGLIGGKSCSLLTGAFLWTTVATSVTGFFFPWKGVTPAVILGILSLIALWFALHALYRRQLAGAWRKTYVITATVALYFNTFALIAQCFQKIPALHAVAPTGSEPPFAIAQGVLLVLMIVLGTLAAKRFKAV